MSRIYFHSPQGDVTVHGSERAWFGNFCAEMAWGILRSVAEEWGGRPSLLRLAFPSDHYARSSRDFARDAEIALSVGDITLFLGDQKVDIFPLILNTAFRLGSDPVKLAARLHGQCEIHAWVDGPDRRWLAGIIKEGRWTGFYRDNAGWESVIDLLEADDTQPVVTSYSVCDQFPNPYIANFKNPIVDGEEDTDAWWRLPNDEQWRLATRDLWKKTGLQLTPLRWGFNPRCPDDETFYFGHGLDANQFVAQLYALEKAKEAFAAMPTGD